MSFRFATPFTFGGNILVYLLEGVAGDFVKMRGLLSLASLSASALASVWPLPVSYEMGDGVLFIDQGVKIQYNGGSSVSSHERFPGGWQELMSSAACWWIWSRSRLGLRQILD